MIAVPDTVNGKLQGVFYTLNDGRKLYLLHRTRAHLQKHGMKWLFSIRILNSSHAKGVTALGVVMKLSGKPVYYLTPYDDFLGPDVSKVYVDEVYYALPAKKFRINPAIDLDTLERLSVLR